MNRHGLPIIWHEAYEVDIGPHVFPTRKYRRVKERVLADGTVTLRDIVRPDPIADEQVALVHTPDYLDKIREGEFTARDVLVLEVPFSPELREAMWLCAGGTLMAARLALGRGLAVHLGGGFHHAFPDHGEGFCLINDVAIAIRALQQDRAIDRAVVIDCDVHHGNGTAEIFGEDPEVFTFSMHQERNYPAVKPPSDLDLGLDDNTGDARYLALLGEHVPAILDAHQPDLAVYLAGADPYVEDQLGGLSLTREGLAARDAAVLKAARGRGVPVAVTLAGGYARRLEDTVEIHCETVRAAQRAR